MQNPIIFTMVKDAEDWKSLLSERDNNRWFYDADLTQPVPENIADESLDDVYTEWGWNTEPQRYPVLAHMELSGAGVARMNEHQHVSIYAAVDCETCNPRRLSLAEYREIMENGGDPKEAA